ncbi:FadR/GntR family transcriptional regulator [Nitrospirillum iridis]|uniref:DNA-binding FadR family transcriptional regulator n=1 Tax=Nitrospirillum iridis TaxID=765888 RepID=A0A7X0B0L2_9PROT|nr:FadR/GntR family transcriptional regulator [Nitrospirillum iridis]MBB6251979.1 DNA-binding FadR family transcriptional regulator [Nitrospirillum iridis]
MTLSTWSSPERPLSHHEQIVRTLGMEILSGAMPVGVNLPPEPDLLVRFQISRTVLREVMKTLAAKGLVVSKTRVGTKVQDPAHWNFFDADLLSWRVSLGLDDAMRRHLYEMRSAVEPRAAALAARRRTPEQLADMRRAIARMAQPGHNRRSFAEADLAFHVAVSAASGNPMMRSLAAVIEAALLASFSLSSPVDESTLQQEVVDSHAAIAEAIEAGDSGRAARAMLAVIDSGFDRLDLPDPDAL